MNLKLLENCPSHPEGCGARRRRIKGCYHLRCLWMALLALLLLSGSPIAAQFPQPPSMLPLLDPSQGTSAAGLIEEPQAEASLDSAMQRIQDLERTVAELQWKSQIAGLPSGVENCETGPVCDAPGAMHPPYQVVYDRGWVLRPTDPQTTPFELKFELHNQFRYTGFAVDGTPSFDAAGNQRDLRDRNDFDINRGRLVFTGYAFDPNFGYYVNIDYSTVASNSILPLLAWTSYRASDRLTLYCGLGKVPGTWEWQQTSRFTLGVDRSMATTFFRPSISAGLWANGSLTDKLHYSAFVGDGFNTLSLRPEQLDTRFAYSGLAWWEPLGDFGVGFSDLECHDQLAMRIGHGLTQNSNEPQGDLTPGPEGTVIRLTDGTILITPGALAPGERVNEFDLWLYTVHAGVKRRGFSLGAEYYFRWLRNLKGDLNSEFDPIFDQGFFAQMATFVIPESLECYVKGSRVTGEQGTGNEVAAGLNCYLYGERGARATLEITDVDDSPAQQSRTGYVAGGSGLLIRAQLWTFF